MIRTIISLDNDEKKWLDRMAKKKHVSMAHIIRTAIYEYRKKYKDNMPTDLDALLSQTKNIWENKDGLEYQSEIRHEWGKKK